MVVPCFTAVVAKRFEEASVTIQTYKITHTTLEYNALKCDITFQRREPWSRRAQWRRLEPWPRQAQWWQLGGWSERIRQGGGWRATAALALAGFEPSPRRLPRPGFKPLECYITF